jgi:hypothetical protein
MFENNKKLPRIFEAISNEDPDLLVSWGVSEKITHNTGILNCSHCNGEAVLTEQVLSLARQMRGFKKDNCGRTCVIGLIIIECPTCKKKYTSHIGMLSIAKMIDKGLWPVRGMASNYIPEYKSCFPTLAP